MTNTSLHPNIKRHFNLWICVRLTTISAQEWSYDAELNNSRRRTEGFEVVPNHGGWRRLCNITDTIFGNVPALYRHHVTVFHFFEAENF